MRQAHLADDKAESGSVSGSQGVSLSAAVFTCFEAKKSSSELLVLLARGRLRDFAGTQ